VAAGSRALVVGSGRGLLAGGLARMGFDVVAVDPSATATAMAREAHERQGLAVVHQTAPAEDLDLPDESFDIAYLADTLEIPTDARSLIRATLARRRGQITDEEIPPIVGFTLTPHGRPVVTYLGYACKARA